MKRLFIAICCMLAMLAVPLTGTAFAAPQANTSPGITVKTKSMTVDSAQVWLTAVEDVETTLTETIASDEKIIGKYSLMILNGSKIKQDEFGTLKASFDELSAYKNVRIYYLDSRNKVKSTKWVAPKDPVKISFKSYKFCGSLANVVIVAKADDKGGSKAGTANEIFIGAKEIGLVAGSSLSLIANIAPANAVAKKITWSSSDDKIATVSKDGVVKGVKAGTVTIKAVTSNGKASQIAIKVSAPASSSGGSPAYSGGGGISYGDDDDGWGDEDSYGDEGDDADPEGGDGTEDGTEPAEGDEGDEGDDSAVGSEDDAADDSSDADEKADDSALSKYSKPSASDYTNSQNSMLPFIIGGVIVMVVLIAAGVGYYLWRKKKGGNGSDGTQDIYVKRH